MSIAMQGLTSSSLKEKVDIINLLVEVSAGTHWMHESFDVSNPSKYTRPWFCWADSLFAELVTSVVQQTTTTTTKTKTTTSSMNDHQQKQQKQQQSQPPPQQVCPLPSRKYSVMEWRDPVYVEGNPQYALNWIELNWIDREVLSMRIAMEIFDLTVMTVNKLPPPTSTYLCSRIDDVQGLIFLENLEGVQT